MVKFCKRCVMPSSRPRIVFNDNGVCNACINGDEKNKINWSKRKEEFSSLISKIKNLDLLSIFVIFFPINFDNPILSTLYLRLVSLIFTFLIIKFSIFLSKDLLTTSTSGNSGI